MEDRQAGEDVVLPPPRSGTWRHLTVRAVHASHIEGYRSHWCVTFVEEISPVYALMTLYPAGWPVGERVAIRLTDELEVTHVCFGERQVYPRDPRGGIR